MKRPGNPKRPGATRIHAERAWAAPILACLIASWLAACSSLPSGDTPTGQTRLAGFNAGGDDAIDPAKLLADDWVGSGDPAGLAAYALRYLGVPYRSGGNTPDAGFDCSGLVSYVSRAVLGLKLPRRSEDMFLVGDLISPGELRPGDLVFYDTLNRRYSHVGIYLGHGRFVHSPATGGVVRIESMGTEYWKKRFNGARRLALGPPLRADARPPGGGTGGPAEPDPLCPG